MSTPDPQLNALIKEIAQVVKKITSYKGDPTDLETAVTKNLDPFLKLTQKIQDEANIQRTKKTEKSLEEAESRREPY